MTLSFLSERKSFKQFVGLLTHIKWEEQMSISGSIRLIKQKYIDFCGGCVNSFYFILHILEISKWSKLRLFLLIYL